MGHITRCLYLLTRLIVLQTCFMELSPLAEVWVLSSWFRYNPFVFPYGCSLPRLSGDRTRWGTRTPGQPLCRRSHLPLCQPRIGFLRTPEFESELPAYYGLWSEAKNENGTTLFVFSPKPLEGRYASHWHYARICLRWGIRTPAKSYRLSRLTNYRLLCYHYIKRSWRQV